MSGKRRFCYHCSESVHQAKIRLATIVFRGMMIVQMYNAILIHRTMSLYTATIMKVLSESEQEERLFSKCVSSSGVTSYKAHIIWKLLSHEFALELHHTENHFSQLTHLN
ncbi:hypothetical protein EMCRGX_G000494 [Ephydatia muelleri]